MANDYHTTAATDEEHQINLIATFSPQIDALLSSLPFAVVAADK
jgi:hypothetical protein